MSWSSNDTKYYNLSPYYLKTDGNEIIHNDGGILFENFYQGSKVYAHSDKIETYCHPSKRGDPRYLWWKYDVEEPHVVQTGEILPAYYTWRKSICDCLHPVRYPVGFKNRKNCLYLFDGERKLNYLQSRKEIYVKEYTRLIRKESSYLDLLKRFKSGENLCLLEIDVPDIGKKGSYGQVYESYTLEILDTLMNDNSEAFGHGLCICKALLEDSKR